MPGYRYDDSDPDTLAAVKHIDEQIRILNGHRSLAIASHFRRKLDELRMMVTGIQWSELEIEDDEYVTSLPHVYEALSEAPARQTISAIRRSVRGQVEFLSTVTLNGSPTLNGPGNWIDVTGIRRERRYLET